MKGPNDKITGNEDILDPRDIAERLEYLTSEMDRLDISQLDEFLDENEKEIDALQEVVDEGIDDTLVREDYFDWERASKALKHHYSVIDLRGGTYYYRS